MIDVVETWMMDLEWKELSIYFMEWTSKMYEKGPTGWLEAGEAT